MSKKPHRGTNGGEAFRKASVNFALSVRFSVELAYLVAGTYSGAAKELNRKKVKTMKGFDWFPATVSRAIKLYEKIDSEPTEHAEN